jgi:hypothetical protein
MGERGVVELQGLPVGGPPGRLSCVDGDVDVEVPKWLGPAAWAIPADEVGVADLTAVGWGTGGDVFRDRLALPYLSTRTRYAQPTLVLLFRRPQLLPTGASSKLRSRAGAVDGVILRVADPARAVDELTAGGAIGVGDPAKFLRQHREVVVDPEERSRILHGDKSGNRLRQGSTILFYLSLFLVTWLLASGDQPVVRWVAPTVSILLAGLLRWRAGQGSPSG